MSSNITGFYISSNNRVSGSVANANYGPVNQWLSSKRTDQVLRALVLTGFDHNFAEEFPYFDKVNIGIRIQGLAPYIFPSHAQDCSFIVNHWEVRKTIAFRSPVISDIDELTIQLCDAEDGQMFGDFLDDQSYTMTFLAKYGAAN